MNKPITGKSLLIVRLVTFFIFFAGGITSGLSQQPQFRPPAVPLVTHDPYFSVWSMADKLTDERTKHWTGASNGMAGMAWMYGKVYRFMDQMCESSSAMK